MFGLKATPSYYNQTYGEMFFTSISYTDKYVRKSSPNLKPTLFCPLLHSFGRFFILPF